MTGISKMHQEKGMSAAINRCLAKQTIKTLKRIRTVAFKGHPFRGHILRFEFMNSKFRVYKHESSSLQTRKTRNISSL